MLCLAHELVTGEALPMCADRVTFEDASRITDQVMRTTAQHYTAAALVSAHRVAEIVHTIIEDPYEQRRIVRGRAARAILDSVLHNPYFMARIAPESRDQLTATRAAMNHLDGLTPAPVRQRRPKRDEGGNLGGHTWS